MTSRFRAWLLILLVSVLCGLSVWGVFWYRSRALTPAAMLKRLPTEDALIVYIDFAALRSAGILQMLDGSKVGEDPDYRSFVKKTEFDYKQDLDTAMGAFGPNGNYMLIKGRFDWTSLHNYVRSMDGVCNNSLCRMAGSTPDRKISFYPIQTNLMALAVAKDESGANRMTVIDTRADREIPTAPVWFSIPPSIVRSGQPLPPGSQRFLSSLERALSVTLSLVPESGNFAARLDVRCSNDADAVLIAGELTKTTDLLRSMIAHENQQPNPADLSGFFTSGTFRSEGARVHGYWTIQRALIDTLFGGG